MALAYLLSLVKPLGDTAQPVPVQLRAASRLVDAIAAAGHRHQPPPAAAAAAAAAAQVEPAVLRQLRGRVLAWVGAGVRSGALPRALFPDAATAAAAADLELFWKMVAYLLEPRAKTRERTSSDAAAATTAAAVATAATAVSPAMAQVLCDLMERTLARPRDSPAGVLNALRVAFERGFGACAAEQVAKSRQNVVLSLAPEAFVRFAARLMQAVVRRLPHRADRADEDADANADADANPSRLLVSSMLRALHRWVHIQTVPRKVYKLVVENLLAALLRLRKKAADVLQAPGPGWAATPARLGSWSGSCVASVDDLLRRSLFAPGLLSTMETSMLAIESILGGVQPLASTEARRSAAQSRNGDSSKRPRKRHKRAVSGTAASADAQKYTSFHRALFASLVNDSAFVAPVVAAAGADLPEALLESAFPALFGVFMDSCVAYVFASDASAATAASRETRNTNRPPSGLLSDHDRTRLVQRLAFKFFAELYVIIFPLRATSAPTPLAASSLRTLMSMMQMLRDRNIFMRGSSHAEVLRKVAQRVLAVATATAGAHAGGDDDRADDDTKWQVAWPCTQLLECLLQMDHRLVTADFEDWVRLLHDWSETHRASARTACAHVLSVSVRCFARVRQLDQLLELCIRALQSNGVGRLFSNADLQHTIETCVAACPAGQVQILWDILSKELDTRYVDCTTSVTRPCSCPPSNDLSQAAHHHHKHTHTHIHTRVHTLYAVGLDTRNSSPHPARSQCRKCSAVFALLWKWPGITQHSSTPRLARTGKPV